MYFSVRAKGNRERAMCTVNVWWVGCVYLLYTEIWSLHIYIFKHKQALHGKELSKEGIFRYGWTHGLCVYSDEQHMFDCAMHLESGCVYTSTELWVEVRKWGLGHREKVKEINLSHMCSYFLKHLNPQLFCDIIHIC